MMRSLRAPMGLCLGVALLGVAPRTASAQGWIADVSAGHSVHDLAPAGLGTTGFLLGLRHEGTPWFFLSAGAPFDSTGLPWGALGLGGRLSSAGRHVALGVEVGAQGFGYPDRVSGAGGGGVTAEAMPLLALSTGSARLELRSGFLHHASLFAGQAAHRSVHQTDARAEFDAGGLVLTGEGRYLRAAEGDYPYVGAAVESGTQRVSFSAYGGAWLSDSIDTPAWGVSARLRLSRGAEAHLSLQQETNDPLYWNAPRRSWNAGFSHRLGRRPQGALPAPAPLPAPAAGEAGVTFRLPLASASTAPRLAGDFTGWQEVPLVRTGTSWSVTLPIPAGVYRYAFRGADGIWFVPESSPGREADGFGGFNAVLLVR